MNNIFILLGPTGSGKSNLSYLLADDFGFELTIPDQFEIEYYTQNNSPNGYLHKIGTCVLESVDVTYGGDKMTWHETNSKGAPPTKTTMALSFKELMTVTKQAIEDGF